MKLSWTVVMMRRKKNTHVQSETLFLIKKQCRNTIHPDTLKAMMFTSATIVKVVRSENNAQNQNTAE